MDRSTRLGNGLRAARTGGMSFGVTTSADIRIETTGDATGFAGGLAGSAEATVVPAEHRKPCGRDPRLPPDEASRDHLAALLRWRRDVRHFDTRPLPDGTFERLLELASLAPSVGLSQPWRFVLVEDPDRRRAVRGSFARCNAHAAAAQPDERADAYAKLKLAGLDQAPCHFAVFADRTTSQGHGLGRLTMPETIEYSAVMAVHTLWLAARAEGLGLGWVSILEPREVAAALDVPEAWILIGYFCLGYPVTSELVPELERRQWEHRRDASCTLLRR